MWKEGLLEFSERFQHTAWGTAHYKRVYEMAIHIARIENKAIDEEALFAAALIHDMGAFKPYKDPEKDHADRSAELCREVLLEKGFPESKMPLVEDIISHHMYYSSAGKSYEAIIFRDADILDFLGAVGITRILSITGFDNWAPDLISAVKLLEEFYEELPGKLITNEAKKIGEDRKLEMEYFIKQLKLETNNFHTL